MSREQDFINSIVPGAQECQYLTNMFAAVTIGQACLETGYGKSRPVDVTTGEDSFNIFGIKASDGEPFVTSATHEELSSLPADYISYTRLSNGKYDVIIHAKFRKFSSITECVIYRSGFLLQSKYYGKALAATTPEDAIHYLIHTGFFNSNNEEIGYATDSKYIDGVLSIMNSFNLKQYDLTKEEISMIDELKKTVEKCLTKIDTLTAEVAAFTKPEAQQVIQPWAQEGHDYVVANKISDGKRPESVLTRQEAWTMLDNINKIKK